VPFDDRYVGQVRLLLQMLPLIAEHESFALKGGTAINLFDRPLPRLSVDIDLAYLPVNERAEALNDITRMLRTIGEQAKQVGRLRRVTKYSSEGDQFTTRLVLTSSAAQIKVEVSPVLRGSVEAPRRVDVHSRVESAFGFAEALLLSKADLYAGKFCAALDRQHPRDLFDVAELIDNEGLDVVPIEVMLVYLICSNRPFHELLQPRRKSLEPAFSGEFQGMTSAPATADRLISARESLITWVRARMQAAHRDFLVSVATGEPNWSALSISIAPDLPAVRWRLHNIHAMARARREESVAKLVRAMDQTP
jgi:predicted nucleotidyltransferase component of viral defense system